MTVPDPAASPSPAQQQPLPEPRFRTGGSRDEHHLGDFTMQPSDLKLLPLAIVIGVLGMAIGLILLDLIGFFTNLLYYGTLNVALVSPAHMTLGWLSVLIPIGGGLAVGLMARYGSEQIRGHGIPEAMEVILVGGSNVQPRLAVLKPISSAISIGTGGPFGAEGPIILTGGAFGSLVAQFFHLSAAERKTLLVAGAAAGMTAVFGTPVASVLFSVELLLFEWKPRSLVPVAAASAVAMVIRLPLADAGLVAAAPLFPVPAHALLPATGLLSALIIGIVGGIVAWLLTICVYGAEDGFRAFFGRLGIHWMWWPAIGGLIVGLGGLIDPRTLGVGYDSIRAELAGQIAVEGLITLFVIKLAIWALALGSGTSGGILAPLLLMGGAVGGLMAPFLPGGSLAIFCLIGMAAALAGVTRSPFTGVIFAFELTYDVNALLPLLIACTAAHAISVLVLKRSILTEKVARRGFHVMREYSVDPLEALFVRDVMTTNVLTVEATRSARELAALLATGTGHRRQRLYPVLHEGRFVGVVSRSELNESAEDAASTATVGDLMRSDVAVAFPDETLHAVAERMSELRLSSLPVIARGPDPDLRGLVSQFELFRARDRLLDEERHREQVLRVRFLPPLGGLRRFMGPTPATPPKEGGPPPEE
ncbi:MAG TPA: chloride channel protein [Candidatus Limnocylindrales bacterium]|nr:chloride channel protein [Candidatus Limnocylindrales bacterium]